MSVRRKSVLNGRKTLYRTCYICGKNITTTADTPWIRQMYNVDGKKQKTVYFCSSRCYQSSYKHSGWYDGLAEKRRREKEARRDVKEKNKRYRELHSDELNKKRKDRYWANRESELLDGKFYREKRRLLA